MLEDKKKHWFFDSDNPAIFNPRKSRHDHYYKNLLKYLQAWKKLKQI